MSKLMILNKRVMNQKMKIFLLIKMTIFMRS